MFSIVIVIAISIAIYTPFAANAATSLSLTNRKTHVKLNLYFRNGNKAAQREYSTSLSLPKNPAININKVKQINTVLTPQQIQHKALRENCKTKLNQAIKDLDYVIGIDYNGIPYSEYGIFHILKTPSNIDINYVYANGKTLLDIAIDVLSLEAFNKILCNFTLSMDTLYHSINYLNETLARLPNNKTRKQMQLIFIRKIENK